MKTLDVVAAIILDPQKRVLLAQRPPGKALAGMWGFPGGKIERGETEEQSLHRELKEELNLEVKITSRLGSFPYTYDWGEVRLIVFVVEALNTPQPSQDVQVFHWETLDAVNPQKLTPADREPWAVFVAQ